MFLIDNILVDDNIVSQPFLCDLKACKGACCTLEGGMGAPLLDEEVPLLKKSIRAALKYLPERSRKILLKESNAFEGSPGDYYTTCIDNAACTFVFYEGGIAKCAIEKAYFAGENPEFRKPISCHLFPIRRADFGGAYLHYQKFEECEPALELGEAKDVRIYELTKDALVRAYGEEWYAKLEAYARQEREEEQNAKRGRR
jgi:hypothetical protein